MMMMIFEIMLMLHKIIAQSFGKTTWKLNGKLLGIGKLG
jgi:hypothetical protein